jgi:hypothetical protein
LQQQQQQLGSKALPVLPSEHLGLLLRLEPV